MALTITYRKTGSLTPDPNNTRTHSDGQVQQIADSILEFGFTNPLLITPANQIIAGEGRWLGAQRAGLDEVPCIVLDNLSERQRRAYVIADNRIAQNSGWDWGKLESELSDLVDSEFNVDVLGFTDDEIETILGDGGLLPPDTVNKPQRRQGPAAKPEPELQKGKSRIVHTCPNCGHTFN